MKQIIAVATVAAAFAIAAPVSAQDATTAATTDTTTTATTDSTATATAITTPPTTATIQMISEAVQRSQKRHEKFLANGTPEQWGSEEPFVFDPTKLVQ
jgi:hypothetical protein